MKERSLFIQSSPFFTDKDSTPKIMYTVILSLIPAIFSSIYFFRMKAFFIFISSIAACMITEAVILWIRKKPLNSVLDGSAIITGLLLAMTLPPSLPLEFVAIGAVAAIAIGKQVFGGLGYNVFNPALVGRAFLQTAFPVAMTTWTPPVTIQVDLSTFATPLADLKFEGILAPLKDLFWGNTGGCIGETSALALILGGLYLLYKQAIDWRIPAGIILSLSAFTGIFWLINDDKYALPVFHILSGGLLIGAVFMATDMVTSPITPRGSWIYAVGIGINIGLIRLFGGFPEGVMYSILFWNTFVPLINRYTRPKILGERRNS
ncbi:MAG: RnfABCDGE type electron transport complex subunit D [Candidatus Aminicenantaceae bacterium]